MSKVLIVEDDELIAELERGYLEAGGFETELDLEVWRLNMSVEHVRVRVRRPNSCLKSMSIP